MKKIKVLSVFGTRPEAIKLAPVVQLLAQDDAFESLVCLTGQHRQMLDQMVSLFSLNVDYDLDIMRSNQSLTDITTATIDKLSPILQQEKPDWLIVQGDTTSCFAAALAGFYHGVKVAHVEAGLRTYDLHAPFPEEANRQLVSRIATLHFAPTAQSKEFLLSEKVNPNNVFVTGNTVIDALLWVSEKTAWQPQWEDIFGVSLSKNLKEEQTNVVLITGHRRENFGKGFLNICKAIKTLAEQHIDWQFVYPVHLNPNVQQPVNQLLSGLNNVHLIAPLDYQPFVYAMKQAKIILTDSGGVQEEAPSLGKPVLVMRDKTERPEGIDAGVAKLVGTDAQLIVDNVSVLIENKILYDQMAQAQNPYGDGAAAAKIIQHLKSFEKMSG